MTKDLGKFMYKMEELIKKSDDIYIIGHKDPDFDSIGAAAGVAEICKQLGKESKIIVDEDEFSLQPAVKLLQDSLSKDYNFINMEEYIDEIGKDLSLDTHYYYKRLIEEDEFFYLKQLKRDKSLLIVVDTNNPWLLSAQDYLTNFEKIIIIDHHEIIHGDLLRRANYFIDSNYSSASEIVGTMLHHYEKTYPQELALALASGVRLDTDTLKRNTTENTYENYRIFKQNGVTDDDIRKLFRRDFESDKLVMNLVFNNSNAKEFTNLLKNHNVSIVLNRTQPGTIYKTEMISQAADERQSYDDVDASIVMGYIPSKNDSSTVKISIRTNGYVDGGELMKNYCEGKDNKSGGGSVISAAAIIRGVDLLDEEQNLLEYLDAIKTDDFRTKRKIKSRI